jgi:large subunit ribosomal protein L12
MEYVYGALLLHKLGQPVDAEHLTKVIAATGASVDESKVKVLIASLQGVDIAAELATQVLLQPLRQLVQPLQSRRRKRRRKKRNLRKAQLVSVPSSVKHILFLFCITEFFIF